MSYYTPEPTLDINQIRTEIVDHLFANPWVCLVDLLAATHSLCMDDARDSLSVIQLITELRKSGALIAVNAPVRDIPGERIPLYALWGEQTAPPPAVRVVTILPGVVE